MTGAVEWLIGTVWFHWKYLSPPLGGPGSLLKLPAMQAGDDPVNNSSNLPEQQKTSEKLLMDSNPKKKTPVYVENTPQKST